MSDNRKRPLEPRGRRKRQAADYTNEEVNGTDNYDNFNFYTREFNKEDEEEKLCFDFYTGDYGDCPEEEPSATLPPARKDNKDKGVDPDSYPPEIWCDLVGTLNSKCGEYSLLEIWNYDEEKIGALTQQDIINAVNTAEKSPVFSYATDFKDYLGDKKVNATGHVVAARAMRSILLATYDVAKVAESKAIFGVEFDVADPFTMAWEAKLVDTLTAVKAELAEEGSAHHSLISQIASRLHFLLDSLRTTPCTDHLFILFVTAFL